MPPSCSASVVLEEPRPEPASAAAPAPPAVAITEIDEPQELCCPILHTLFRDPVFVPESGTTYEREAITQFWSRSQRLVDPLTNKQLSSAQTYVNWDKRREVSAWLAQHPTHTPAGWASRDDIPQAVTNAPAPDRIRRMPRRLSLNPRTVVVCVAVVVALAGGLGVHDLVPAYLRADDPCTVAPRAAEAAHDAVRLPAPVGSRLEAATWDGGQRLSLILPRASWRHLDVGTAAMSLFSLAFTASWTTGALAVDAPLPFVLVCWPFWHVSAGLLRDSVMPLLEETEVQLHADHLCLHSAVLGLGRRCESVPYARLTSVTAETAAVVNDVPQLALVFRAGERTIEWGTALGNADVEWCLRAVQAHLRRRALAAAMRLLGGSEGAEAVGSGGRRLARAAASGNAARHGDRHAHAYGTDAAAWPWGRRLSHGREPGGDTPGTKGLLSPYMQAPAGPLRLSDGLEASPPTARVAGGDDVLASV